MGDIYCARCGEPWDSYGITYSMGHGDMTVEEAIMFKEGKGCPSCGFGTKCPNCSGTGRKQSYHEDCLCKGWRYLMLAKCPTASDNRYRDWHIQYTSPPKHMDLNGLVELKDDSLRPFYSADGKVYLKKVLCPECSDKAPVCTVCNGTGKFTEKSGDFSKPFISSLMDNSDEDPIKLLEDCQKNIFDKGEQP